MKKYLVCLSLKLSIAAALALSVALPATAQQAAIGRLKRVAGTVSIERNGQSLRAEPGALVYEGDRLRTGADGYAGLTLADDTRLNAGPGSLLLLNRFAFDPTTQDGEFKAALPHGRLQVVSGQIAKKAPEKFELKGRTVVLGVRGTEFIVAVDGPNE